jgi:hypothetical protein
LDFSFYANAFLAEILRFAQDDTLAQDYNP